MNQEKIGKFIQEMRKKKGLTQEELAEKLNVSNKSISRWENGNTMPDYSLFGPICNELNITINELMSGEKINEKDYRNKLEENMLYAISSVKKKHYEFIPLLILIIGFIIIALILFCPFKSTTNDINKLEIDYINVFGEIIYPVDNKNIYIVYMKSATISKKLKQNGCIMPIEVYYKDGHKSTTTMTYSPVGETRAYLYGSVGSDSNSELRENINDNVYFVSVYDFYIEIYLDEPIKEDYECQHRLDGFLDN